MNLRARIHAIHQDHHRIARAAGRVAFFLVIGKLAGALKEMAIAYRYGVSPEVDAYQFTMTLATWLPVTVVGVLSVVLIPVFVALKRKPARQQREFIDEFQGWLLMLGLALVVLTVCVWPEILRQLGAKLTPEVKGMTTTLLWAFAPGALLTLFVGFSAARLRSQERHINTLLDSLPALVLLLWLFAAGPDSGIEPLLWGTLLGLAAQAGWTAWLAAKTGAAGWGSIRLSFRSAEWPTLVNAMGIMLIGQIAMSFVGPLDQYAAATIGNHANSTMGYASRLLSLLLGIGAASVGRAALPVLADIQSGGDSVRARSMALKWSVLMLAAGCATVAVAWILTPIGVELLFQRGAFTAADTVIVSSVLRWGLLQVPFFFGVLVLVQLLASQQRYALISLIAVLNFALKAVLNFLLAPHFGLQGIMIATACMYALSYFCYLLAAKRLAPEATTS